MGLCASSPKDQSDPKAKNTQSSGSASSASQHPKSDKFVSKKFAAEYEDELVETRDKKSGRKIMKPRQLGVGASCSVKVVRRKADGQRLALKVLQKSRENLQLFKNETKVMRLLNDPHIVEYVESFEDGPTYNIVTVLCEGGELFDRVTSGPFSEKDAARLTRAMLLGIKHCHDRDVTHRDIKPENYVFETPAKDSQMKLIDFGCALQVGDSDVVSDVAGSPYYVAPEVLKNGFVRTGRVWRCADMWSIGVVVYLLVHGYPPFNGQTQAEIFARIRQGRFRFKKSKKAPLSPEVTDLISRLLMADPLKRLTVNEALEHAWVKDPDAQSSVPLDGAVLDGLRAFQSSCRLKKAVVKMLTAQMTEADKENLKLMFSKYDTNGDGRLDAKEVAAMLKDIGQQTDPKEFIAMLDNDDDGAIDQNEFQVVGGVMQSSDESKLEDVFKQFDTDKSGKLDADEVAQLLKVTEAEAALILAEVDKDGDQEVDFEEFVAAMSSQVNVERVLTNRKAKSHPNSVDN